MRNYIEIPDDIPAKHLQKLQSRVAFIELIFPTLK